MRLRFTKMHGLGNDFVLIDARHDPMALNAEQARTMGDRRLGIGCDQILIIEPPENEGHTAYYRVYNQDGSEVEQCGNGARCIARFLHDRGGGRSFLLGSRGGEIEAKVQDDGQVRVDMGVPDFAPADIPFMADEEADRYEIDVDGETLSIGAVSMGNPHAVLEVEDVRTAPVGLLGARIESHPRFPMHTNVGFVQRLDEEHIRLRVFERGTGETLACGTGACAAVAVGRRRGELAESVHVDLPGGRLEVAWSGPGAKLYMSGPATRVFEGEVVL